MTYALITVIENNDNLHSGDGGDRPPSMEKEAILCFESWRRNGGEFKDIPIYAMCPTKRTPSSSTVCKLKDLGVTYIQHHLPETDDYTCGFWNVPIACKWLEENLTEDFLIHIDLDMYLLREPSKDLFTCGIDSLARIGSLSGKRFKRNIKPYDLNFETCFINSWRANRFYLKWYSMLKMYEPVMKNNPNIVYSEIEEHIIDMMYHEGLERIEDAGHEFQFGSWYPVEHIEDINNTYFRHEHLEGDANTTLKNKELVEYLKRVK